MLIRHAVKIKAMLLFMLSSVFSPLAAGEGVPTTDIIAKLISEADKPRMSPEIALPTEAEVLAGLPEEFGADQHPEALRYRREAILARRILMSFIASHVASRSDRAKEYIQTILLSEKKIESWLARPPYHQFVCCAPPAGVCDSHRFMTPEERRDDVKAEIVLSQLALESWRLFDQEADKAGRYSDDYRALLNEYRRWAKESGHRDVWVMVFVPGKGEDAMKSARQRAEAAYKRLMDGFSWEQVAQEDSDNEKTKDTPPNGVLDDASPWHKLGDAEKLWEKLKPGEVSAPLELEKKYVLVKWQPIDDKRILSDMAWNSYGPRQKSAWRSAALEAAAEALRSSSD